MHDFPPGRDRCQPNGTLRGRPDEARRGRQGILNPGPTATIKLDASKAPKWIDLTRFTPGIYKLEGDSLTICRPNSGTERPKEFKAGKDDPNVVVVYQRASASGKNDPPQAQEIRKVQEAASQEYVWPADKLKEGKIAAPDLSQVAPLLDEDFGKAGKRLVGIEMTSRTFDKMYEGGRYVIAYKADRENAFSTVPVVQNVNRPFAFQVVARVTGQEDDGWGVTIKMARPNDDRGINVKLARDGSISFHGWFTKPGDFPGKLPRRFTHAAVKKGDDDNALLVVMRGRHLELYCNGAAVCDPVLLDDGLFPIRPLIVARPSNKGSRVEFQRITLWPADDLPSLEARGAIKQ